MDLITHPGITLRQLVHFVTAAEFGTMSEAARRLHLAPSAVSMSIAELERAIGAQLCIKRKAKGLQLTPTGAFVRDRARQVLALTEELEQVAADGDRERLRGPLAVGCFMPLGPAVLPPLLAGFAEACPHVDVDFVEGYHDELQEQLLTGAIDVALLYDLQLAPALRCRRLQRLDPVALLAATHPLADRAELTLADIADEPLILVDAEPVTSRVLSFYAHIGATARIRHRARSYATVRSLVGRGRGVAVLFQEPQLAGIYEDMGVVLRPLADLASHATASLSIAAVWAGNIRPNARARAWLDVADAVLGDVEASAAG